MKKLNRVTSGLFLIFAVLSAVNSVFSQVEERRIKARQISDTAILDIARQAPIIVVGKVLSVSKNPGFWSGLFPAYQDVRYTVTENVKGLTERVISVRHPVVKNSLTADSITPQLSPVMFAKGQNMILFLEAIPEKEVGGVISTATKNDYRPLGENLGAIIYTLRSRELISEVKPRCTKT